MNCVVEEATGDGSGNPVVQACGGGQIWATELTPAPAWSLPSDRMEDLEQLAPALTERVRLEQAKPASWVLLLNLYLASLTVLFDSPDLKFREAKLCTRPKDQVYCWW